MARVTVCLAVFNGEATLRQALETVRQQTYQDLEILVLDDGSTDPSAEIAREFGAHILQQKNAGLGAGRKRLVEEAPGELIAFLDHDDYWTPTKLEEQVRALDAQNAVLVHSDGTYLYDDGRRVPRHLQLPPGAGNFDHILPNNDVIASTALFRRQAMLDVGNFAADTVRCSDWWGWLLLARAGLFVHLPALHVLYSVRADSLANAGVRFHTARRYVLENKVLPNFDQVFGWLPEAAQARRRKVVLREIGVATSTIAKYLAREGNRAEARRRAWEAVRWAPTVPRVWARALRLLV